MTNTGLPAPRDLPPLRHVEIRAAVRRAVAEPPRRRRWVVPVVAVATLSLTALAVLVVPRLIAASGPGVEPAARIDPFVANLPEEERKAIEQGCVAAAGRSEGPPAGRPAGRAVLYPDSFRLVNLVLDDAGTLALLYGRTAVLHCLVEPGGKYKASADYAMATVNAPDGPLTLDLYVISAAGEARSSQLSAPDTVVLAGRVGNRVDRVTVTMGSQSVNATVTYGTFLGRIVHPAPWITDGAHGPVVRAYDANGTLLATVGG